MAILILLLLNHFTATTLHAAHFANQFIEFELPKNWTCGLEGAEWVCQNTEAAKRKEALVILAAKIRGPQDSLDGYLTYLKQPKFFSSVQGHKIKSTPRYAKSIALSNHPWIDALHFESEVPNYYTRYLATVKEDIGVLVTYSIQKDLYSRYVRDFETLVNTLRVFRKPGGVNSLAQNDSVLQKVQIPSNLANSMSAPAEPERKPAKTKKPAEDDNWLYVVIGVGILAFVYWKRKKNQSVRF